MAVYLIEQEVLNPVSLEKELGLPRGAIARVTIHAEGAVEIETPEVFSGNVEKILKATLLKFGLPKGKKE